MTATNVPTIKVEQGTHVANGSNPHMKVEDYEGTGSPVNQVDEDIYEDTGELDFSNITQNVYLTKLPRELWDIWSTIDDDQEIRLGTVRVEEGLKDVKRVCLSMLETVFWANIKGR